MNDSNAGLSVSLDASAYAGPSDTSAPTSAFQDQLHGLLQSRYAAGQAAVSGDNSSKEPVMVTMASPSPSSDSGSGGGVGGLMNYAGYITYISLAASAFGHDDPLQLQTKATRFFQEKILHHHAIDNPQVWAAMGDALMTEQHLAGQGAKFKPVKLRTLNGEVKHESTEEKRQGKEVEHYGKDADAILKDITAGLKSPADYVLAAKFLYAEAVEKADVRGVKEATDHKDEKRLLGRLSLLSGETDRTDAFAARDNSLNPILDELGSRVSYRLDEAALLDRFGGGVPELGWTKESLDLREQARAIYNDPKALSEPVRRRLHEKYADILTEKGG